MQAEFSQNQSSRLFVRLKHFTVRKNITKIIMKKKKNIMKKTERVPAVMNLSPITGPK